MNAAQSYYIRANRFINHDNDQLVQFDNAILGIVGEVGELVDYHKKNKYHGHEFVIGEFVSELGDLQWYIHLACYGMNLTFHDLWNHAQEMFDRGIREVSMTNRLLMMSFNAGKLADIWSEHGVDSLVMMDARSSLVVYLDLLCIHCLAICKEIGMSIEGVWEVNVSKLWLRYPNGFEAARSINRSTLESHS